MIPAPSPPAAHFSAADFFRDAPWLKVPLHRKADIMIEPLYPRLGLLGGAPEAGGKVSKLAALAQARKKKEGEKTASALEASSASQTQNLVTPSDLPGPPRSLAERLAANTKTPKPEGGLRRLGKPAPSPVQKQPAPEINEPEPAAPVESVSIPQPKHVEVDPLQVPERQPLEPVIRAPPSMFASTIVGDAAGPTMAEPSHLHTNSVDLLKIYGQDHAEPFDFAGPSPDDVVLNAQNTAKGLAIRNKVQKPVA